MLVSWARFRQGSKPHNEGLEGQEPQTQSLLSREPQAREGPRPTARAVGSPGVPIQPPHTPPAPRPSSRPRDHPAAASPKPALRLLFVVEREGESGPTIPAAPTAVRFRFRRRTGISGVWFSRRLARTRTLLGVGRRRRYTAAMLRVASQEGVGQSFPLPESPPRKRLESHAREIVTTGDYSCFD